MLAPRSRALASLLLWPLLSCGAGSHASKLVVTSAVAGEDGERPTLRIQFAEPVIDAAQIGTSASDALARLEPAVPLEGYWLDRQTLALTPLADLNPSTRYKVELMGELAARTENFRFDFVHQPLMVEGVWGVDIRALPQRPKLPLNFNQPVDPLAVLEHCRLRGSGDEIELVLHSGRESTRQVVVGPSVDLAQGQDFQLTCSGLSGLAGPEPIQQPFHTELATHPAIGIRSIIPDSWDTPTDDLKIEVSFTTPVELQDARAH